MHKVFFRDRAVFFDDNFASSFRKNSGLFYKFRNRAELKELIEAFFKLNKINHLYLFHPDIEKLKSEFVSCFKLIKASGGLLKNKDGKFLMIFRDEVWDLPKGKNDPGESSEETALREVSEECGLHGLSIQKEIIITYHTYILNNEPILKETVWFELSIDNDQTPVPQKSEKIELAVWKDKNELGPILKNTYPSIMEVLKADGLI